jgi:hypothetical protein
MEPHFPEERRTHRVFSGIAVVLTMVSLVLVFMLGVIVYKLLVYRPLAKNPSTKAKAQQIANMTGAMVNLMTIMILSRVRMVCCFVDNFGQTQQLFSTVHPSSNAAICIALPKHCFGVLKCCCYVEIIPYMLYEIVCLYRT